MNTQKSSKKTIWIIVIIVVIAAVAYFYFEGASVPSTSGLLQTPESPDVTTQVIGLLAQIQAIRIDSALFTDPAYQTLRDYSVAIPPQNVGRTNPFAPIPGVVNHSTVTGTAGH